MKVLYALLLFPLLGLAVPEKKVYPNSGATEAATNQQIDVTEPQAVKVPTGPAQQQMQVRPVEDPNAIQSGPYDKDGNYIYLHKKP